MDTANYQQVVVDRLRKIIERAFDYKAEGYFPSELANYFTRRELLPTLVYQRMHHALKGRKGTGKTAILKYLSLPVQVHCLNTVEPDFAGFYLTFGENYPPQISFDPEIEGKVAQLFGHWFNLYACKAILDSLAGATREGFKGVDAEAEKQFLTRLWTSFFMIPGPIPSSFIEASSVLNEFQSELRRLLSKPFLDKTNVAGKYLKNDVRKYRGSVKDVTEFVKIIEIVTETIHPLRNKVIFILMDEYDNLSVGQQTVVNTAMAGSTGSYYMKVGVLSERGIKDRNTLTGLTLRSDQLKFIDIEQFESFKEYEDFVKASIEARFTWLRHEASGIRELEDLFDNVDKLLPGKNPSEQLKEQGFAPLKREKSEQLSLPDMEDKPTLRLSRIIDGMNGMDIDGWWTLLKHDKQPTYCGLKIICLLSSCLIRSAIEIVYAILKDALTNHWDAVQQGRCIPYDIQDSVIRKEADHWLTTKLRSDIKGKTWDGEEHLADVAGRLIRSLKRQFYNGFYASKELVLSCFSLREFRDPEADGINAVREGELTGIFARVPESSISPKDAAVFLLHRIYSVQENLPPVWSGCLRLSWSKFEEYCRPPRGVSVKQQDMETPYFFGIGFRETWENRVRQELPGMSPQKYRYSNGAGAHEGSILVVGTVENKIDAARLCIFDITTENENVCFEYGLALVKRKSIRHFLNRSKARRDLKELVPFLRGIVVEQYSFSDEPDEHDLESLRQAMANVADWHAKRQKRKGKLCSIVAKCKFNPTPLENQVFIATPQGSLPNRCLSDLHRLIREDLHLQVYEIRQTGEHYICDVCQAIGRSKYCIVDTSGCDPTCCGMLGLGYGFRRKVMNIYDRNNSGLITNYADRYPSKYGDKQELLNVIRTFLQS